MIIGTVESISKNSLVVSGKDVPATILMGKPVEALVADLKLGDNVEYEIAAAGGGIVSKITKAKLGTPPAAKTRSNSPVEKFLHADKPRSW